MGDEDGVLFSEQTRRVFAGIWMYGGWLAAATIFAWATLEFDPAKGHFAPQWVGFSFIGSLCIGIAGTMVRSRMRLQATILQAFAAGAMANMLKAEREHDDIHRRIDGL